MCEKLMAQVTSPGMTLDLCMRCQFVWFDPAEFEAVPAKPLPPAEPQLPQKAREIIALHQVEQMARALETDPDMVPADAWKIVPAVFGYPIEDESTPLQHLPLLTWSIAGACVLMTLVSYPHLREMVNEFGFIPGAPFRYGGLTVLTSLLLHGGWLHLLGNMYFLLIFGDNVEDFLGKKRFLLLAVTAMIIGDFAHWLGDRHSTIPTVGASGMISGVLAFYAMQFPHARLALLMRYQWVRVPAWSAFLFWGFLQIVGVLYQLAGLSNVSALAHIGGALSGIALGLWWRRVEKFSPAY
jgi:membrane associated rhomboid family serine protease